MDTPESHTEGASLRLLSDASSRRPTINMRDSYTPKVAHFARPTGLCWTVAYFLPMGLLLTGLIVGLALGITLHKNAAAMHVTLPSTIAYDAVRSRGFIDQATQHVGVHNSYSGAPREESNRAWSTLLENYNLRIPARELPDNQAPSIPIEDGSDDVWVSLSVYHHLHCLDSLRHQIDGNDCPSEDTSFDENGFSKHFDHCIETLRQWLICQPDLSLRSVYWREDGQSVAANNTISHQCLDWGALSEWVKLHTIDANEPLVYKPDGTLFPYIRPPPPRCASRKSGR